MSQKLQRTRLLKACRAWTTPFLLNNVFCNGNFLCLLVSKTATKEASSFFSVRSLSVLILLVIDSIRLGWKKIEELIARESKLMVFKSIHGLAPQYMDDFFTKYLG